MIYIKRELNMIKTESQNIVYPIINKDKFIKDYIKEIDECFLNKLTEESALNIQKIKELKGNKFLQPKQHRCRRK